MQLPMSVEVEGAVGVIEAIVGHPLPVLRCFGWLDSGSALRCSLLLRSGEVLEPVGVYRFLRQDVNDAGASAERFCGFNVEFLLGSGQIPEAVVFGEHRIEVENAELYATVDPHYGSLYTTDRVLHREDIYLQGGPCEAVNIEIRSFSMLAEGRTLDFGCGNGIHISEFRARGIDAFGIELKTPRIERTIPSDLRQFITLYDGEDVLPYENGEFNSIFSSEVIEHVIGIEKYIPEFHRILRPGGRVIMTTPDMTCIPSSFLTNTVPWHILESTHFNFFNMTSLKKLFGTHFEFEKFYRFGQNWVNGTYVPGSIGFVARRRD